MKTKLDKIAFLTACLVLCIGPSAGMLVAKTDTTTENRTMAEMPHIVEDEKPNVQFLKRLGEYFEDHFAFRNQLVTADSKSQSKVFGVSDMDTVIVGTDGWLYYKATLDDYLGQNTISERKAFNVANNISILQKYVESKGAEFIFTVAPNKNSLYGENMPYYYQRKEDEIKNMSLIEPYMKQMEINYANLFEAFEDEEEVLYLKRDSHWSDKGALLAYNTILNAAEYEHETYETTSAIREKTEYGDLNKMLYPMFNEPEWNYDYQYTEDYTYTTNTQSVEDAWIATEHLKKENALLMFRDSFGNTLLPFMANEFGKAYFSKGTPYSIEKYMNECSPYIVIAEKVERNIVEFAQEPPIMTGPEATLASEAEYAETNSTFKTETSEYDSSYIAVRGIIDSDYVNEKSKVYVKITFENAESKVYEAFTVSEDESDNGYLLYLGENEILYEQADIEIITSVNDKYYSVKSGKIEL